MDHNFRWFIPFFSLSYLCVSRYRNANIVINVFVLVIFFLSLFCDNNKSNFEHCVSYSMQNLCEYFSCYFFFSRVLTLESIASFITSVRWEISHLLGVLWLVWVLFCWQLTSEFLVQFHALIVLHHLLIILRVSARFFQSFILVLIYISFCRLQLWDSFFSVRVYVNACRILMGC